MRTLFSDVTVVTQDVDRPLIPHGYVVVEGDRISYVGTAAPEGPFHRTIPGAGRVLMPGLVDAHTHLPMTLMRGYGGGCDLQTWLNDYIFPAEDKLDPRAVRAGTRLALAELIAAGVTAVADMYYFCDDIAQCVAQSGISANLSRSLVCFAPVERPEEMTSWREMEALYEKWHGYGDGQILVDVSIHGEYTSHAAPNLWEAAGRWAYDRGLGMQVHLSETRTEHQECIARHGITPAALFARHGLFRPRTLAAHCVHVSEEDIEILASHGVTAVHNPVSNLKLASGIAPVPALLAGGVNVCLGTDGVASNNAHDMLEEVKLAATLHKGISGDPTAVTARQALAMATRCGGKALGRDTGVVAPGMVADLILLDFHRPHLIPCHDVEENLTFSARGSDVVMNMARGRVIYEEGTFHTLDLDEIRRELRDHALPLIFD